MESTEELRARVVELEAKLAMYNKVLGSYAKATGVAPDMEGFLTGLARLVVIARVCNKLVKHAAWERYPRKGDAIVDGELLRELEWRLEKLTL